MGLLAGEVMSSAEGISIAALASLFESLEDGVCVSEGERILYWNPAAREFLRAGQDATGGKAFCDFLCGRLLSDEGFDCSKSCPLRFSVEGPRGQTFSGRLNSRDIRVRCLKIALASSDPKRPEPRLTMIEDVTKELLLKRRKAALSSGHSP